ncbi:TonB-dependent receptor [Dysgonomonas sp. GY75]|uniref:TonB-dependent receptor n=1 Tax=Dysgonomonas sp. GY75 TaxID=2780419 RepID=UPI001883A413|nr:carboxypeptidase-like regulatory domain-containing protein [Dysgonomonas sp. GY75]MBF0650546.1 TonB-dependent receptor [Dysgonomonas sp. GY75]
MNKIKIKNIQNIWIKLNSPFKIIASILILFFSCISFANAQSPKYSISGKILEESDQKQLVGMEYVTVSIPEYAMGTVTNEDGYFAMQNIPSGKVRFKAKYVGMLEIDTLLEVNKDISLSFTLKKENFRLSTVVITATNNKAGQSTASFISRNAIDHLQATNLSDIASLLPGGLTSNPDLTNAKQIKIREVSADNSGASMMNTFGLSIIKDGSPISNNANLQLMSPSVAGATTTLAGGTPPTGGTDLRLISTDNIESIEIIRGIPSVQYGDLTSGAIIINSKAGRQPLQVAAKTNSNVYQFSAASGFNLGGNKGALNVSGDYAHNTNDPTESYQTYERSNIKVLYSNRFFDRLFTNTSIDFAYGADRRRQNPDDEITKLHQKGDNIGGTLNTNGILRIATPWLSNIRYVVSASYTSKKSYMSQLYTNATSPYSMTTNDGTVLSNRPGVDIFDNNGNKITNFSDADANLYAVQLPASYEGRYDIEGKEVNVFAKLMGTLFKRLGNTNHTILVGADFKTDGNEGAGKTFSQTEPPYRNLSAPNASFRPRSYKDIPYVKQLGLFAEENFRYSFGDHKLQITGGLRYDKISVVKEVFSPRVNASFEIIPQKFSIRGGYGVTAKAPSTLFLYPELAYFEYVNMDELSNEAIPESERLYITTTRVFDTQNKNLKIAKSKKAEVGFDLNIKQATLSVTGFIDRLQDGYSMSPTINSFRPVTYYAYQRINDEIVQTEALPVLAKYYTPTNNIQSKAKGVEFDLNLGRFDAIRTAFSINGMWIRNQSYSSDYTFFDGNSGTGEKNRTHIALYEKGMEKNNYQRFTTTLRATHNIPEIGFVVTLTAQAIWNESQWYNFGNDSIPVKYISKNDGLVYDFDPGRKDEAEFKPLIRQVNDKYYIKENYPPAYTFNINVTKELGNYMRVSFFANNMFRTYYKIRSNREPSTYRSRKQQQQFFFGMELSLTL